MNADQLNIDDFVDYAAEYRSMLKNFSMTGDRIMGRCPFHDDRQDSFTADAKTGMCHCFTGCIDGNFISFWSKFYNTDTKTAYKQILDKYGKLTDPQEQKPQKPKMKDYTLSEYSFSKRLPEEFLKDVCLASTGKDRDGVRWLKLPY